MSMYPKQEFYAENMDIQEKDPRISRKDILVVFIKLGYL